MKRKDRERTGISEMDLTSMIDVTFLLLIFFLLGTRFKAPEGILDAHLPKDEGPQPRIVQQPVEKLTVRVRVEQATPFYQIGEVTFPNVRMLESHLRRLFPLGIQMQDGTRKPQPVTIAPEQQANYKDVVAVLDACMRIGYSEISFAAPVPARTGGEDRWY